MSRTSAGCSAERRYQVEAVRSGERTGYLLEVSELGDHRFQLEASGPTGKHVATATDLFEALRSMRREIEPHGWLLAVQGARRDTWPSGMLRDQLDGAAVYILPADPKAVPETVGTFDPAPWELLATVAEQEAAWESWKRLPR